MPGPAVHLRLTAEWAMDEGMPRPDAEAVGNADHEVDRLWPGSRKPWRHFNPTATLLFAPRGLARAIAAGGDPSRRQESLVELGRALYSRQDGIGHGILGLSHLRWDVGLLKRNPDDWDAMPAKTKAAIERATRDMLRRYLVGTGRRDA